MRDEDGTAGAKKPKPLRESLSQRGQVLRHPKTRSPLGIKIKGKHPEGLGFGCEASGYLARAGKVPLRFEDMPQPLKPMLVSVALRHD
jgi:hypothetical protein